MRGTCTDNHRYRKAVISVVYRIKIPYQVSRTLGTDDGLLTVLLIILSQLPNLTS